MPAISDRPVLAAVLFTSQGSSPTLDHCLWSVVRFAGIPYERILLADDSANPLPPARRKALEDLGIAIIETSFDRRRNLNGHSCIKGILETMSFAAEKAVADYILKIDPDTMLFSSELTDNLSDRSVGSIGGAAGEKPDRYFFGMCYALRRDIIGKTLDFVSGTASDRLAELVENNRKLPEDYTISGICSLISPSTHRTIPFTRGRGFHCSWPYGKRDLSPIQTITSFGAVHFGQWHLIPGTTPDKKRQAAGAAMSLCRNLITSWEEGNPKRRKCLTVSFGGFGKIEGARPASFTGGYNSTFVYDLTPEGLTGSLVLSAWVDQELHGTNNEGVDWTDAEGVARQEQVEFHIYRSVWAAVGVFPRRSPDWYKGGNCCLMSFTIDSVRQNLLFYEFERTPEGVSTMRDEAGRTIMITRTEESA